MSIQKMQAEARNFCLKHRTLYGNTIQKFVSWEAPYRMRPILVPSVGRTRGKVHPMLNIEI
jgi:hypothetical protein